MNKLFLSFFLNLFLCSFLYSEPSPVGPVGFGGGLNLLRVPTDISDDQSPDMCDCINNEQGGIQNRNGSKKFVEQPISSYPITSLYSYYVSTGNIIKKTLISTTKNLVLHSTGGINPIWIKISSAMPYNSNWNWVTMNQVAIGVSGDSPPKKFNLIDNTFSDLIQNIDVSSPVYLYAKYPLVAQNYLFLGNVYFSTYTNPLPHHITYNKNRVYYSFVNQSSSFTANRFETFGVDDGEEIIGLGQLYNGVVNVFKQNSIWEISFNILNPNPTVGNQIVTELIKGFGLVAPRSLQTIGQSYIFASNDGIRIWDGGRRSRLTVSEESRIISYEINTLIESLIKSGTYKNIVGKYYKKKEWYVMSYEDPNKFPKGVNNSLIIYDLKTNKWFPICGLFVSAIETLDFNSDNGEIFLGNSKDGYVYQFDLQNKSDDPRKEIVIDVMESSTTWIGSKIDLVNVKEGTASLRIETTGTILQSSMSILSVFPFGEWYDKSRISKRDKISFKAFPKNLQNISSLRIDLEINSENLISFDQNFTSITLTSSSFLNGNNQWTNFEISLSSFPILNEWIDLNTELFTYANTLTFYGIRFVLNGVDVSSVSIDDLRIVQEYENPVNFYYFSKLFNFGTTANKSFGQILLTYEKSPDTELKLDVYNDFGSKVLSTSYKEDIQKQIIVYGLNNMGNISLLNTSDFNLEKSTELYNSGFLPMNGVADKNFIFFGDRENDRLVKMDRNNFGVIVSSLGNFGTNINQFNIIHQQDLRENKSIFLSDIGNQRIKEHKYSDLSFVKTVGTLGAGTSNFHQPTGICNDETYLYIADESNYRLIKLSISTFGFIQSISVDYNTVGESSLEVDERYLYLAYNKLNETSVNFQDVVLEKRDKVSMNLINKTLITNQFKIGLSSSGILGDIGLMGDYIYIAFTDNIDYTSGTKYFIQKRLKSDFSLVKEYEIPNRIYGLSTYAYNYKPQKKIETKNLNTDGVYLQIKFYTEGRDNKVKLINQTILLKPQNLTY